ncbi:MAG TPA: hypothetical protein VLG50_08025 [Candidatus Saccharimonadales bacterium]|nr:hypothetical protein [Candidatus Saccharimonadales bacterium]
MAAHYICEEIEELIRDMDTLSIDQIKERLKNILINPCDQCHQRCGTKSMRGSQLFPETINTPTESHSFEVCAHCHYVVSWCL